MKGGRANKTVRSWLFLLAGAALFLSVVLTSLAQAQNADDDTQQSRFRGRVHGTGKKIVHEQGQTVVYKKKNVVDFDDSLIEGDVRNPSEFYFTVRPTTPTKNLIDRRKNFHKEMLRDTVMIR